MLIPLQGRVVEILLTVVVRERKEHTGGLLPPQSDSSKHLINHQEQILSYQEKSRVGPLFVAYLKKKKKQADSFLLKLPVPKI